MFRAAFYKATRPGIAGHYNRAVRAWERGPYSHVEAVFSDGMAASSSFADGGVRFKEITFNPNHWDFLTLPSELEQPARYWFETHVDWEYDLLGNLHFIIGTIGHSEHKVFCSEAIAAALGIKDPWRYGPNVLYSTLQQMTYPIPAVLRSQLGGVPA